MLCTMSAFLAAGAIAQVDVAPRQARSAVAQASPPTRAVIEQKALLLLRLMSDSPAARRIGASAEAKAYFARAQRQHEQALALLDSGELVNADALLSEALALMSQARRLTPDVGSREEAQRQRYVQLADSMRSLSESYERHRARAPKEAALRIDSARTAAADAVRSARTLEQAGRYGDAIAALSRAEHELLHSFNAAMGTTTLEFSPEFNTLADEFNYELDRNHDYATLVPVALDELKPSLVARQAVAAYVADSNAMREMARGHAARQDYEAALSSVRQSTLQLQRALAAAGLVVPSAPGEQ